MSTQNNGQGVGRETRAENTSARLGSALPAQPAPPHWKGSGSNPEILFIRTFIGRAALSCAARRRLAARDKGPEGPERGAEEARHAGPGPTAPPAGPPVGPESLPFRASVRESA